MYGWRSVSLLNLWSTAIQRYFRTAADPESDHLIWISSIGTDHRPFAKLGRRISSCLFKCHWSWMGDGLWWRTEEHNKSHTRARRISIICLAFKTGFLGAKMYISVHGEVVLDPELEPNQVHLPVRAEYMCQYFIRVQPEQQKILSCRHLLTYWRLVLSSIEKMIDKNALRKRWTLLGTFASVHKQCSPPHDIHF